MQNNFNTVIIQTPQIILECSEWIQYELEIFIFSPTGVWARPTWMLSSLWSCGFYLCQLSVSEAQKREKLVDSTERIWLSKILAFLLTDL